MGTRNLTMVINKKGELKVAQYGQWDGYPEGQGTTILEFARNKEKMRLLETALENVKFYNKCNDIDDYIESYDKKLANGIDRRTDDDIYWFNNFHTRDLGGEILDSIVLLDKSKLPDSHNGIIYLNDSSDFGKDDVFCEWAYCINLQTNKLECYTHLGNKLTEFDLDSLPNNDDFAKCLNSMCGED